MLRIADDIRTWFRTYKIPEGKGENSFAFGGKWLDLQTTLDIIESTHQQYLKSEFATTSYVNQPSNVALHLLSSVVERQHAAAAKQQFNLEPLASAVKPGPWVPPAGKREPLGRVFKA